MKNKLLTLLITALVSVASLCAEPAPQGCHCQNCKCTPEKHCGCFSESGCHCPGGQCPGCQDTENPPENKNDSSES